MKVVILEGSPRRNGNTYKLAKAFQEGVQKAGNEAVIIETAFLGIKPCLDCKACYRNPGVCVQKDNMNQVYEELKTADAVIYSSPVYFYGVSAQLKAVLDRWHNPVRDGFKVKTTGILSVCADVGKETFDPLVSMLNAVDGYMGWKSKGSVLADGFEEAGCVSLEYIEQAEKFGEEFFE